ncbi:hypothetical protein Nepgr_028022 [Nepenthes gracilis]|uniref:Uncharacterized protein n=1 Tax=Nepenthes gracilis TaxID=150966 RepID=A0AAD3TC13_NEPGR|nr:hypothetical protein Nepgr_028022 [Nepenthes gracilis]
MVSSLYSPFMGLSLHISASEKHQHIKPRKKTLAFGFRCKSDSFSSTSQSFSVCLHRLLHKPLPLAFSLAILLCSTPAKAGFLSGSAGLESFPGPQLPSIDFLNRFNEENQKRYAENDARIKSSPIMKELLERSKRNREKNRQELQDKYCIRGAEWGVGDCSAEGMTPEDRENFIAMLKRKAAEK